MGCYRSLAATTALLTAPCGVRAQAVPRTDRLEPEVTWARDFAELRSVVPMSDGRVVAVEGATGEVLMLSADGADARLVGARGEGPGEYLDPFAAVRVGGADVTLIVDGAQQRLLVADPAGRILASEPWRLPMGAIPRARDATEGMYWDEAGVVRLDASGAVVEGPAALLRIHPGSAPDTVATLEVRDLARRWEESPISRMFRPGPGGMALFRTADSPFGWQDQWALRPDGSVAVARVQPYRIDVVSADGTVVRGPEVPVDELPVTRADRVAWMETRERNRPAARSMTFNTDAGGTRALPAAPADAAEPRFPDTKPPFPHGGVHAAADGTVWVQRNTARDAATTRLDVFDGEGRLVHVVTLPAGRTLRAVGAAGIYATRFDEFDVQYLERYALP